MKNKITVLSLLITLVFSFSACTHDKSSESKEVNPEISKEAAKLNAQNAKEVKLLDTQLTKYQYQANLNDVTGGNSTGEAMAGFIDGEYKLMASFRNLPAPQGSDFYEGWVVRKSPFSAISTGALWKNDDGIYMNTFTHKQDLTDHGSYVLTIEPDDGDPAPAAHVQEGKFTSL